MRAGLAFAVVIFGETVREAKGEPQRDGERGERERGRDKEICCVRNGETMHNTMT